MSTANVFNLAIQWNIWVSPSPLPSHGHSISTWRAKRPNDILAWFIENSTNPQLMFATRYIEQLSCQNLNTAPLSGTHTMWQTQMPSRMFAAKVVTHQWRSDYHSLCAILNWQTLSTRRKIQKLKVCYNILNKQSIIPATTFTVRTIIIIYLLIIYLFIFIWGS